MELPYNTFYVNRGEVHGRFSQVSPYFPGWAAQPIAVLNLIPVTVPNVCQPLHLFTNWLFPSALLIWSVSPIVRTLADDAVRQSQRGTSAGGVIR